MKIIVTMIFVGFVRLSISLPPTRHPMWGGMGFLLENHCDPICAEPIWAPIEDIDTRCRGLALLLDDADAELRERSARGLALLTEDAEAVAAEERAGRLLAAAAEADLPDLV